MSKGISISQDSLMGLKKSKPTLPVLINRIDQNKPDVFPIDIKKSWENTMPDLIYGGIPNFDLDGDGKLNEKEKAAALAWHEKQAAEKIKAKFDFNGNGKLDPAEEAAYKAYINGGKDKTAKLNPKSEDNTPKLNPKLGNKTTKSTPNTKNIPVTLPISSGNSPEAIAKKRTELQNNVKRFENALRHEKQMLANLEKQLENTSWYEFNKKSKLKGEIECTKRNIEAYQGYLDAAKKSLAEFEAKHKAE